MEAVGALVLFRVLEANHKIVALEDNVGRIYGSLTHGYHGDSHENIVGQNGTKDGNIALSTSIVSQGGCYFRHK